MTMSMDQTSIYIPNYLINVQAYRLNKINYERKKDIYAENTSVMLGGCNGM